MSASAFSKDSARQKIRRILLILTFILIPVTIFYVSPIVIMMGASEGIVSGSMILFILLFIISLFAGRIWCGWLCPMGAWQELCSPVISRKISRNWLNWIKFGIALLWLGAIAFTFRSAGGIRGVDPFYGTVNGISVSSPDVLMIVGFIFAFIFIVAFITGKRGFCHVFCPIATLMIAGRWLSAKAGLDSLKLGSVPGACIDCNKCTEKCPMGLDVHAMVRNNTMESSECILCASCTDICPKGAITYSFRK